MTKHSAEGVYWGWLKTFFRKREFTIEWDGNMRGLGKTNVGALKAHQCRQSSS